MNQQNWENLLWKMFPVVIDRQTDILFLFGNESGFVCNQGNCSMHFCATIPLVAAVKATRIGCSRSKINIVRNQSNCSKEKWQIDDEDLARFEGSARPMGNDSLVHKSVPVTLTSSLLHVSTHGLNALQIHVCNSKRRRGEGKSQNKTLLLRTCPWERNFLKFPEVPL